MQLPLDGWQPPVDGDAWLVVQVFRKESTTWADGGHPVAWAQFPVGVAPSHTATVGRAGLHVTERADRVELARDGVLIAVDTERGQLASFQCDGRDLVTQGPTLQVWRAPTDNDANTWGDQRAAIHWREAGLDRLVDQLDGVTVEQRPDAVRIEVRGAAAAAIDADLVQAHRHQEIVARVGTLLTRYAGEAEVGMVAQTLGHDYNVMVGDTHAVKVGALMGILAHEGRLAQLLTLLYQLIASGQGLAAPLDARTELEPYINHSEDELLALLRPPTETRFDYALRYATQADGGLAVELRVVCSGAQPIFLPRLGVTLTLPGSLHHLTWYGRGPHENYRDRKESAAIGVHTSTVAAQFIPYLKPQEHGNHTETRWVRLADDDGTGLLVVASSALDFSAHHFTTQDLERATHTYDLVRRDAVVLNLDLAQGGLGNGSCGPGVLPQYMLLPGEHVLAFSLYPVARV